MRIVAYAPRFRDDCLALFDRNCPAFFAANERSEYEEFLSEAGDYHVCLADGAVVGAYGVTQSGDRARIRWIMIDPAWHGRGIGRLVMNEIIPALTAGGVRVLEIAASHLSEPFFRRFGAVSIKRTENGWGPEMHRVGYGARAMTDGTVSVRTFGEVLRRHAFDGLTNEEVLIPRALRAARG